MAIYLEYDGIKGNVTASGYEGCIAINSVNFGINRGISMVVGHLSNREISRPVITEVTLGKIVDGSVVAFFKEAVSGSESKNVIIKFIHTGENKVREYMSYVLENCLVSSYMIVAKDGSEPTETIALSFSRVMVSYIDYDSKNKPGNPQHVGYDLVAAKRL